jgi:hypothetical protein
MESKTGSESARKFMARCFAKVKGLWVKGFLNVLDKKLVLSHHPPI